MEPIENNYIILYRNLDGKTINKMDFTASRIAETFQDILDEFLVRLFEYKLDSTYHFEIAQRHQKVEYKRLVDNSAKLIISHVDWPKPGDTKSYEVEIIPLS